MAELSGGTRTWKETRKPQLSPARETKATAKRLGRGRGKHHRRRRDAEDTRRLRSIFNPTVYPSSLSNSIVLPWSERERERL
ncbi:hypothetical protein EYF80_006293 [Liparis tanakae]|uniref:Uncharacterized protein n=1 Tax=Liparis tanakae TaxID=230148 RepID=A0A4Z2J1B1_9TELE|nr:hypothetical protein EYF80_006293 [Liparis tanakae]